MATFDEVAFRIGKNDFKNHQFTANNLQLSSFLFFTLTYYNQNKTTLTNNEDKCWSQLGLEGQMPLENVKNK